MALASAAVPLVCCANAIGESVLNVSARTVRSAAKIRNEAVPELVAAVEQGRVSVFGGECD
jgi:hypothetical protein